MSGIPASMLRSSLERLGLTPETRWLQEKREKYDWSAVKETPGVYSLGHGATDIASEESTASIIARIRASRVTAAHNLIQAISALERPPATFVGQSAIGYYGDRGAKILDEESQPGEGFGAELPVEWEAAQHQAEGVVDRVVILRTGLVLDADHGLLD